MAERTQRVLFATESLDNGGAERQLALLAMNLPPQWQPEVWSMEPGPYQEVYDRAGIPVTVSPRRSRFDVRPGLHLWRYLLKSRPDVVYLQGWMTSLAAGPACAVLRIPLVDSRIRGAAVLRHNHHKFVLGRQFSDIIVANSAAGLAALRLRTSRGRVIPNGFDCSRVLPRDRQPFSTHTLTVVMTGRMQQMKDWDLFVAVARLMAQRQPGTWRFLAVGDGPERLRLMGEAADLIADGSIEFPGEVTDVMPLLSTADVGVLLTNPRRAAEGCSNSILEYMASGLPVVCSDLGGNGELVQDGATGFLVLGQDAEKLADRLQELAAQPQLAREMGELGARRVREEFSIEALVRRTMSAFQDAAKRKGEHRSRSAARGDGGAWCE